MHPALNDSTMNSARCFWSWNVMYGKKNQILGNMIHLLPREKWRDIRKFQGLYMKWFRLILWIHITATWLNLWITFHSRGAEKSWQKSQGCYLSDSDFLCSKLWSQSQLSNTIEKSCRIFHMIFAQSRDSSLTLWRAASPCFTVKSVWIALHVQALENSLHVTK